MKRVQNLLGEKNRYEKLDALSASRSVEEIKCPEKLSRTARFPPNI